MWRLLIFFVIAGPGLCSTPVVADVVDASAVVSLPWEKFCLKSTQPGKQVCFTGQKPPISCDRPVASASLQEDGTHARLSINFRHKVIVERGVRITIDQGQAIFSGPFLQCDANGCLAVYEAGPELISQLKGGRMLIVEATGSTGQPIKVAFSLAGFAEAYNPPPPDPVAREKTAREELQAMLERAQQRRSENAGNTPDCGDAR